MSKPIEVGCVAEVVRARGLPEWVGRTVVVTAIRPSRQERGALRYATAPAPEPNGLGWKPECLRRIDPPDWEAPRVADKALEKWLVYHNRVNELILGNLVGQELWSRLKLVTSEKF